MSSIVMNNVDEGESRGRERGGGDGGPSARPLFKEGNSLPESSRVHPSSKLLLEMKRMKDEWRKKLVAE